MSSLHFFRELRALDVLDVVPAGHIAVLVRGDQFEPHLYAGEFAIIDTADTERVFGELYALTIGLTGSTRGSTIKLVELIKGFATGGNPCEVGVWFAFGFARDIHLGGGRMARYVDGPLRFDAWPDKCRGAGCSSDGA